MNKIKAIEFDGEMLHLIDQTKLPLAEELIVTDSPERIAIAIERLEVRGAPAIGIAAAYALALALKNVPAENQNEIFNKAFDRLAATRPTAVNLFYALNEIKNIYDSFSGSQDLYAQLIKGAVSIHYADIELCERIGLNGIQIFTNKSNVLTHCNTGALATGGEGTALNVIRKAFQEHLVEHVFADETRPLLQGSRLTAWELHKYGIPFSINTDSTAAVLMKEGKVDLVIVGADRIAKNGDSANKIGTYNLAVLCNYHKIPFYIAAPETTIDRSCLSGENIVIELRNKKELIEIGEHKITDGRFSAYCPSFDVTPNSLITAIITDKKVYKPPYHF